MRTILFLVVAAGMAGGSPVRSQVKLDEPFNARKLDPSRWCPCQIDMQDAPVMFPADPDQPGNRMARIVVDEAALGGNVCHKKTECPSPLVAGLGLSVEPAPPDQPEPLGPPLLPSAGMALLSSSDDNPYCTEEVRRRGRAAGEEVDEPCFQRQELRFADGFSHRTDEPHDYAFRFRLPKTIEDTTNNIRWVTAQWKQDAVSEKYAFPPGHGPSPFLAQRFVNGVLHVTIQDEHCRCIVASAPLPDGSAIVDADGKPLLCGSTEPGRDGDECPADLMIEQSNDPALPTARGEWAELTYRVEAGRAGDAVIDISEAGRRLVRIRGKIGYKPLKGAPSVKFKIGHYRDYMPYPHKMEIDWLRVAPAAP